MKKSLVAIAAAALLLTGCGSAINEDAEESPNASVESPESSSSETSSPSSKSSKSSEPSESSSPSSRSTASSKPSSSSSESSSPSKSESSSAKASDKESDKESDDAEANAGEKSSRGNGIATVGGDGLVVTEDGETLATVVLNSIEVDPQCTGDYVREAENGHLVTMDFSVKTESALAESDNPSFDISAFDFKVIKSDGSTSNAELYTSATYSCLKDTETIPDEIGPGETVGGKLVLDVESPEGTLIWKPFYDAAGWEWTYPTK